MSTTLNAVTDRTIVDVNRVKELVQKGLKNMTNDEITEFTSYMKGRLVASDLNRIDSFINVIGSILSSQNIGTIPTLPTTFADGDIVSATYIQNLTTCVNFIATQIKQGTIDLTNLDFVKMNTLESILREVDPRVVIEWNTGQQPLINEIPITPLYPSVSNYLPSLAPYTTQVRKVTVYGGFSVPYCNFTLSSEVRSKYTKLEEIDLTHIYHDSSGNSQIANTKNFYYTESLKKVLMPECLTSIESNAFNGCGNLEYINIPKNVSKIQNNAFMNCTKLKALDYGGTMAEWNNIYLGTNWKAGSAITKIICTDGTISV